MRSAFTPGTRVVVVGWESPNHNTFTRGLPQDTVRFYDKLPDSLPERTSVVIATRAVSRPETEKIRRRFPGEMFINLKAGEVKKLLVACKDLLSPTPTAPAAVPAATIRPVSSEPISLIATPSQEELKVTQEARFTAAFMAAAKGDPNAAVSKMALAKIRKEIFGDEKTVAQLVSGGWLEPVKGAKKIGSYKAGPRMLEVTTAPQAPDDPVEWARYIIHHSADLQKRKADLESELAKINEQLQKSEKAAQILRQLEELMPKKPDDK